MRFYFGAIIHNKFHLIKICFIKNWDKKENNWKVPKRLICGPKILLGKIISRHINRSLESYIYTRLYFWKISFYQQFQWRLSFCSQWLHASRWNFQIKWTKLARWDMLNVLPCMHTRNTWQSLYDDTMSCDMCYNCHAGCKIIYQCCSQHLWKVVHILERKLSVIWPRG